MVGLWSGQENRSMQTEDKRGVEDYSIGKSWFTEMWYWPKAKGKGNGF